MEDIQQYIELVRKELEQYMVMIFEDKLNKNIFNEYLDLYIDIRYFNSKQNIKEKKDIYEAVLKELGKTANRLVKIYEKDDVLNIKEIFSYIVLWDNVGKNEKDDNIINKINEFRKEKLNIKLNTAFSKKLLKEVISCKERKDKYIKKFFGEEFKLKNKKTNRINVELVELKYNINFPSSVSNKIIKNVFNTGITKEDKLLVEYHMINAGILQDMIKGNFYKEYIADFSETLLNKKNKLSKTLKIISDEFQKERINLLMEYKNFTEENKTLVYDLMRQGFKVSIRLDETFKLEEENIKKLNVFSYIVIDTKKEYSEIVKYKEISKKIIKV